MKYLLLAVVFCSIATTGFSQDSIVLKATKVPAGQVPQAVLTSHKNNFPDSKVMQYFKLPPGAKNNEWVITESDNLQPGEEIDRYSVTYKMNNGYYQSLYSKDGTLLRSQVKLSNVAVPKAIMAKFDADPNYKGYVVIKDRYTKLVDHKEKKEYYRLVVKKDKTEKTLTYAPDGTFMGEMKSK